MGTCMRSSVLVAVAIAGLSSADGAAASRAPVPQPGKPANGVYLLTFEGEGRKVTLTDGSEALLGKRLDQGTGSSATLKSVSNDNSRFAFTVTKLGPLPEMVTQVQTALVIDGVVLHLGRADKLAEDGTVSTWAMVSSAEAGRTLAAYYKVKPELREHPGHRFEVRWTPENAVNRVGGEVTLKLEITNAGNRPLRFSFGGKQRGARNNQFRFLAYSGHGSGAAVPDTGNPMHFGGRASINTLKPGETFSTTIDLAKWFRFTEPDSYRITGILEMPLYDAEAADPWSRVLWDELAVGECVIRVTSAPPPR
jgi:hypothetical protein